MSSIDHSCDDLPRSRGALAHFCFVRPHRERGATYRTSSPRLVGYATDRLPGAGRQRHERC